MDVSGALAQAEKRAQAEAARGKPLPEPFRKRVTQGLRKLIGRS